MNNVISVYQNTTDYPDIPEQIVIAQFHEHIQTYGNPYDINMDIMPDGKIHRYRVDKGAKYNEDGAYMLHVDGHPNGWVQNWADGSGEEVKWDFDHKAYNTDNNIKPIPKLTDEDRARIKAKNEDKKKQAEAKRQREINEAVKKANEVYNSAQDIMAFPDYVHPYLLSKGLQSINGLRVKDFGTGNETLVVPLYNTSGELRGIQYISPDPQNKGKFVKKYNSCCDREGTFCVIHRCTGDDATVGALPDEVPSGPICFVEGLATGMTVYNVIEDTGDIVICAMDCGALEKVAKAIMSLDGYAGHEVLFFADNDHETYRKNKLKGKIFNPGITNAIKAARAIGVDLSHIITPNFSENAKKKSDWNDLYMDTVQFRPEMARQIFAAMLDEVIANARAGKLGLSNENEAIFNELVEVVKAEEAKEQEKQEKQTQRAEEEKRKAEARAEKEKKRQAEEKRQQEEAEEREKRIKAILAPSTKDVDTRGRDYRKMPTSDDINRALSADTFDDFRSEMEWLSLTPLQPEELMQIYSDWVDAMFPWDKKGKKYLPQKITAFRNRLIKGPTDGELAEGIKKSLSESNGNAQIIYTDEIGFYKYKHGNWSLISDREVESMLFIPKHWNNSFRRQRVLHELKALTRFSGKFNIGEYMNFTNGMLELATGELLIHDPKYYNTQQVSYKYDQNAACPTFATYLEKFTNSNSQRQLILQEFAGYCLFNDVRLHKTLFLLGEGRNGKSIFLDTMKALLGKQNCSAKKLTALKENVERIHLKNKLLNISDETIFDLKLVVETLKAVVAGTSITGNYKFKDTTDFTTHAKFISAFNRTPKIDNIDTAILERIIPIRCVRTFIDTPDPNNTLQEKADITLQDKILKELPGIFNWAYKGYKRLIEQGKFSQCDEDIKIFRQEFIAESDPLMEYLAYDKEYLDKSLITTEKVFERCSDWSQKYKKKIPSRQTFMKQLKRTAKMNNIFIKYEKRNNTNRYVSFTYNDDPLFSEFEEDE